MKLLVVGAGAAGLAALHRAHELGADVRLIHDRAGSTELSSGAIDLEYWTTRPSSMALDAASHSFIEALGLWQLADETLVATGAGVVRPARGADRALLNLAPLAGLTIGVPDVERDDWGAPVLVRSLQDSAWARATGTRFEVVGVPLLRHGYERRVAPHDFAALHDEPDRRQWLIERLGNAAAVDAWLMGPWLGRQLETLAVLNQTLGMPVGEIASSPGGVAGVRFASARQRLIEQLGIPSRRERVQSVVRRGTRFVITLAEGACLHADAVVLALGGVAAGGIVLDQAACQVQSAGFRLAIDAPVDMFVHQRRLDNVSSAHGFDFAGHGLGILEAVGARVSPGVEGLKLAGDVMAGRPNTILMGVAEGIRAAEMSCEFLLSKQ